MPTELSSLSSFQLGNLSVVPDRNVVARGTEEFRLEPRRIRVLPPTAARSVGQLPVALGNPDRLPRSLGQSRDVLDLPHQTWL